LLRTDERPRSLAYLPGPRAASLKVAGGGDGGRS
jgi:hypothetical protein